MSLPPAADPLRPVPSPIGCALAGLIATGLLLAAALRLTQPAQAAYNSWFIDSLGLIPVSSGFWAVLPAVGSRWPLAWRPLVGTLFSLAYAVAKILVLLCAIPAVIAFFFLGPFTLLLLLPVFVAAFPLALAGAGLGAAAVWGGYRAHQLLAAS